MSSLQRLVALVAPVAAGIRTKASDLRELLNDLNHQMVDKNEKA